MLWCYVLATGIVVGSIGAVIGVCYGAGYFLAWLEERAESIALVGMVVCNIVSALWMLLVIVVGTIQVAQWLCP